MLELYKTDELGGRQFPSGTWSIDFLAIDKDNNDLVVIELKRGKTSNSTVGLKLARLKRACSIFYYIEVY